MTCATKNCERIPERNGYCATCNRSRRKAAAPKAKPARKRIAKQSEEGKERTAVYLAIKAIWIKIPENVTCHVCAYRSTTEPHHMAGKLGDLLYDVRRWLPVCRECHDFIEKHPETAYMNGWSQLRNANEPHEI